MNAENIIVKLLPLEGERESSSLANTSLLLPAEHLLRFNTLLVFIVALEAIKFGIDIASLAASEDCGSRSSVELLEDPAACIAESELAQRMQRVGDIFTVVILVVLLYQLVRKFRNVAGYYRSRCLPRCLTACLEKWFPERKTTEWVAAGSADLYAETMASISQTSKLSGLLILPFAIACTAVRANSLIPVFAGNASLPAKELCGSSSVCLFAHCFGRLFTCWGHYMTLLIYLHINIYRRGVWSAIMDLTAKSRMSNNRIRQFMWLPLTCLLTFSTGVFIALYMVFRLRGFHASSAEVIGLFVVQILYALSGTFQIFLARIPNDIVKCMAFHIRNIARRIFQGQEEVVCSKGIVNIYSFRDDTLGNLLDILLFANMVVWLEHVPLIGAPVSLLVTVFAFRVLILILILCSRQKQSGFQDIESSPCFGLVIDARALRRILQDYAAGKPPPTRGVIPTYKGTLHRMRDTLAVSYRWQGEEAELAPGISLNMNMYQIKAVLEALHRFRNRYVWLDRLSVPQDDQPLKFTLLARMMAVYTAAKVTLAIRTCEESGSRYHQRAWTCQEFVVARRLVIATQMPQPGDTRTALSPECDERMAILRKRVQTQRFVPLWLRANSSTSAMGKVTEIAQADGESILKEFHSLSDNLSCQFPGDRLRALLPLVSCAPLEDHQELVSLVLAISRATGDDLLDWKESLLEQHKKEWQIKREKTESAGTELRHGGVDSATDVQAGIESSDCSDRDPWQVWHSKSAFRARVMGNVSQESVLEECNELQGIRRSKSVSGQFSTELSDLQYIKVPHRKQRRPVRRDSTVGSFSGPSSSKNSSRTGPSSFIQTTDARDSMHNDSTSQQYEPTDQQGRRHPPAKQRSLLADLSRVSSAPPEEPTPTTTHIRPPATMSSSVVTDMSSYGQDGGLADNGACRARVKRRVTLISSVVSALSKMSSAPPEEPTPDDTTRQHISDTRQLLAHRVNRTTDSTRIPDSALPEPWFPGTDDGQTNEEVSLLPCKHQHSFFSALASALSTGSAVHPYKHTLVQTLKTTDAALLHQAAPEMLGPRPESHASGTAEMQSHDGQLTLTSEARDDNVNLPGAADESPVTPAGPLTTVSSCFTEDSARYVLGSSPTCEHSDGPMLTCISQGFAASLPTLHPLPVPQYNPHPAGQEHVSARVSLPTLHQPHGVLDPSALGEWRHAPDQQGSLEPKHTSDELNDSTLMLSEAARTCDFVIDMPDDGSKEPPLSVITSP